MKLAMLMDIKGKCKNLNQTTASFRAYACDKERMVLIGGINQVEADSSRF
jgi:hypothetical protein